MEANSIQEHASKAMGSLNRIGYHANSETTADDDSPNNPQSKVHSALAALASSSSIMRELNLTAVVSEAETALSRSIALVKNVQSRAAESLSTHEALVRAHDIANADVEYFRAKCQEVTSRAAELGKENRDLSSANEIAMSTARDGVKQAEMYFGEMKIALQRKLAQTQAHASMLAQRCEKYAAKAHLIPLYKAEAERLYKLDLGNDDLEFPLVIDAVLGKFQHLHWRWQEDFASVGSLLSIDAEEFNDVEDFAATLTIKVEELLRCGWTDLGELSKIGIRMEGINDLHSLVSLVIDRFKAMQDTIQQLRRLSSLASSHNQLLQPISTPDTPGPPISNTVVQYFDVGADHHSQSLREATVPAESSANILDRHSRAQLPVAANDVALSNGDREETVRRTESPSSPDPDEEIYPCPSRDRDNRPCTMIFTAFDVRPIAFLLYRH